MEIGEKRWFFRTDDVDRFFTAILASLGFSETESRYVIEVASWAHQFGRHTHSFAKWLDLCEHILLPSGTLIPGRIPLVNGDGTKAVETWDGNHAVGPLVASMMLDRATELAQRFGYGEVRVGGTNHYLCGAYYCYLGAKRGMWVGTTCTSAFGFEGVLDGGRCGNTGTNPITQAMMVGPDEMFLLDMATTEAAMGLVHRLRRENSGRAREVWQLLPMETFLDEHGEFTTDPEAARTVRVFGGAKGSGLNMLIEFDHATLGGSPAIWRGRSERPKGETNTAVFTMFARDPAVCSFPNDAFPAGRSRDSNIAYNMRCLVEDNGRARIPGLDRVKVGEALRQRFPGGILLREADLRDFRAISQHWKAAELGVDFSRFELEEVTI